MNFGPQETRNDIAHLSEYLDTDFPYLIRIFSLYAIPAIQSLTTIIKKLVYFHTNFKTKHLDLRFIQKMFSEIQNRYKKVYSVSVVRLSSTKYCSAVLKETTVKLLSEYHLWCRILLLLIIMLG